MTGFLNIEGVTKRYGEIKALDDVTLEVSKGKIFSLLGPSGCGKTTLLRICAGFEDPDAGRVILDGKDITHLPPNRRPVNTVFQNYALFPHMSVRDNIAFGPRTAGRGKREVDSKVDYYLDLSQMRSHADKKPRELSGGQRQRVAIARALINEPQLLLLDEPLAALDLKLRQRMLVELDDIHDRTGTTFLFVTHDQGEAMGLSDTVAVLNHGRVEQVGTPSEIYEAPRTGFVAAFIGDTNFLDGVVVGKVDDEYSRVRVDSLGRDDLLVFNDRPLSLGEEIFLSVRPEKIGVSSRPPAPNPKVTVMVGEVEEVIYLGSFTKFWVRVGAQRLSVQKQHDIFILEDKPPSWNDKVWLSLHADYGYILDNYQKADEALLPLSGKGAAPGGAVL